MSNSEDSRVNGVLKIDLQSSYHQLKVKGEVVFKTAIRTRYGHYEFMVLSFGLTNTPIAFMGISSPVLLFGTFNY